jgi:hypothetical protein
MDRDLRRPAVAWLRLTEAPVFFISEMGPIVGGVSVEYKRAGADKLRRIRAA